jgi:hypothetical protein
MKRYKIGDVVIVVKLVSLGSGRDISGCYPKVVGSLGVVEEVEREGRSIHKSRYIVKILDEAINHRYGSFLLLGEEITHAIGDSSLDQLIFV